MTMHLTALVTDSDLDQSENMHAHSIEVHQTMAHGLSWLSLLPLCAAIPHNPIEIPFKYNYQSYIYDYLLWTSKLHSDSGLA